MPGFLNAEGSVQQVELNVGMYREAARRGMNLQQYINATYPTNAERYGSTFNQLMSSEGIYVRPDRDLGIRPSTLAQILNGPEGGMQGATNVKDAVPASRILFPAVVMGLVEDKLAANLTMTANAFDSLVAVDESINGNRYEQPVLNFSNAEKARSQGIAQLAQPASMMLITTSEKAWKIPEFSLGLEISDQALQSANIDFLALSLARQAAVQRNERAHNYMLALWNGDIDNGDGTLASKGVVYNASTFDAAATGGVMTHKAWIKSLMKDGTKRTITHMITDFDTAWAIENRQGKPEVTKDDSKTSRMDTQFSIMNPTWAKNPDIFLIDNNQWPANTIMMIDKAWAIRRVRSLTADYQGIESYVMRRSTAMRFDFGEHVNRLFDEAYMGLVLA